jgi:serine/threonine protein kinase
MADVMPSDELIDEPSDYGSIQPGTRLGRYELLVPIARGGMARVWAARLNGQRGFQKLVAIKTILPHLADEPEFERMFLDEARIASGVHHPNVCEIYELGEEKRTLYLAMEWVNGDSLARVLRATGKTEALDPRVVARVVADACAGLHAAHELTDDDGRALGVVHRDLSPHNILLTADGTAKVADFGVAKALGQLHEATSAGQLKGKIAYMAPEQVTGSPVDRRSDVFSLGCVLYEATTGQRPFRGDGDHQVMHAVLKGEVAPPSSIIRGYPQELERIVLRALAAQPILRYPTAERMRFALEELLARGQLVTQSNVAQVVRARIGAQIDKRKERIRQASTAGDGDGVWSEAPGGMTPSNQATGGHRSGVKPSSANLSRPLFTTMAIDRPPPVLADAALAAAAASATVPQASAYQPSGQGSAPGGGHTPVSHPGAAYSQPSHPQQAYSYPGASRPGSPPPVALPFGQTALVPPDTFAVFDPTARPGAALPQGPQMSPLPPSFGPAPASMSPHQGFGSPAMHQGSYGQHPASMPFPQQSAPPFGPPSGGPQAAPFDPNAPSGGDHRPSEHPAGPGSYAVAIGVGVLLAVLIGVGGFFAWRGRHAPPTADRPAVTSSEAPTPVPVPVAAEGASAAPGAAQPSSVITFEVAPAEATLSVDGQTLAPGVWNVLRPAMGKTVTVVASAKGHEDVTVLVDFFTTSPMEVTLKPLAAGATDPGAKAGTNEADPSKDPPKKDPPKSTSSGEGSHSRPSGRGDPALPPNPF